MHHNAIRLQHRPEILEKSLLVYFPNFQISHPNPDNQYQIVERWKCYATLLCCKCAPSLSMNAFAYTFSRQKRVNGNELCATSNHLSKCIQRLATFCSTNSFNTSQNACAQQQTTLVQCKQGNAIRHSPFAKNKNKIHKKNFIVQ